MSKILVTGATGNVGGEVAKALIKKNKEVKVALFNNKKSKNIKGAEKVLFDFASPDTWKDAMKDVDAVFLMRPPAISDVKKQVFPFIDYVMKKQVKQVVFLSLQGVQHNFLTPHYKIEKYLKKINAPYTFLRPNFFMQNLSTTYKKEIKDNNRIFLPAGNGKTAFVDVRDIAAVAAKVFTNKKHIRKAYELSGAVALDYYQVAKIMSSVLGKKITYSNPSFGEYANYLRQRGFFDDYIKVQKMLYFVVRHNLSKKTSPHVKELLHRSPISFKCFVEDNKSVWA